MNLLDDDALERSSVVANCRMNRERRLPGYDRELGINVVETLRSRRQPVRWLDLCCGTGNALGQAAELLGDEAEIVGVDLVDFFDCASRPPRLRLITASVVTWEPEHLFDLITCVHGLHYIGDKLGVLARIGTWLADDGLFVANFDVRSIRLGDGTPAGRHLTTSLRSQGVRYDGRTRRISWTGRRLIDLPYRYQGSDDQAGPNYTGQPAVNSYYDRHAVRAELGASH
ncbi:trans-aconitate 2-methyltransferase [Nonomuraea sp. NEAU-A123]|uniref:class I SAM-dependent methyltransferase n=1 Tax=Nonomuraea sp. NEAU-A123 TaxID=2839649 RepID=UPI001BE425FD|nr:methyltransferase domain-containing protein [Nonomuraea sp. NEAU-A123]MBT2228204.1 methyltransferase domain-containing protein [Nonomuraea sp. NEAU-A123]